MLYKHHLKEFDSWLENSLMTDSDKIAFDQWIKNSPNPIYLPPIGSLWHHLGHWGQNSAQNFGADLTRWFPPPAPPSISIFC